MIASRAARLALLVVALALSGANARGLLRGDDPGATGVAVGDGDSKEPSLADLKARCTAAILEVFIEAAKKDMVLDQNTMSTAVAGSCLLSHQPGTSRLHEQGSAHTYGFFDLVAKLLEDRLMMPFADEDGQQVCPSIDCNTKKYKEEAAAEEAAAEEAAAGGPEATDGGAEADVTKEPSLESDEAAEEAEEAAEKAEEGSVAKLHGKAVEVETVTRVMSPAERGVAPEEAPTSAAEEEAPTGAAAATEEEAAATGAAEEEDAAQESAPAPDGAPEPAPAPAPTGAPEPTPATASTGAPEPEPEPELAPTGATGMSATGSVSSEPLEMEIPSSGPLAEEEQNKLLGLGEDTRTTEEIGQELAEDVSAELDEATGATGVGSADDAMEELQDIVDEAVEQGLSEAAETGSSTGQAGQEEEVVEEEEEEEEPAASTGAPAKEAEEDVRGHLGDVVEVAREWLEPTGITGPNSDVELREAVDDYVNGGEEEIEPAPTPEPPAPAVPVEEPVPEPEPEPETSPSLEEDTVGTCWGDCHAAGGEEPEFLSCMWRCMHTHNSELERWTSPIKECLHSCDSHTDAHSYASCMGTCVRRPGDAMLTKN